MSLDRGAAKNDGELLADFIASQNECSFEELVRRHGALVFNVCHRVCGDTHDAEDAAQAVFITLARKAGQLRREGSVAGWLHHVAWCIATNARKTNALRSAREKEAGVKVETALNPHWEYLKPLLDVELGALPEKYRLPVILHHLEGRGIEDASRLLGWKTGTFASRLGRGKELLKERLARRGAVLSVSVLAALLSANASAAPMPPAFIMGTAHAALAFAGKSSAGGVVSAQAAALSKSAMKMLFVAKLKVAAGVTAAALICGTGAGVTIYREVHRIKAPGLTPVTLHTAIQTTQSALPESEVSARTAPAEKRTNPSANNQAQQTRTLAELIGENESAGADLKFNDEKQPAAQK